MCSTTSRNRKSACDVSELIFTNPARANTLAEPKLCLARWPKIGRMVSTVRNIRRAADASSSPYRAGSIQEVTSRSPSMVKRPTVHTREFPSSIAPRNTEGSFWMRS